MPVLNNFTQFDGLHWETGTIRNYLDYRGAIAPHTNQPYTEALLFGISGGAVVGYFTFSYEGYDPIVAILTRNTFDPMDRIFKRMGISQNIRRTGVPEIGFKNLNEALENGVPAITWADMFILPYNAAPQDEQMWAIFPSWFGWVSAFITFGLLTPIAWLFLPYAFVWLVVVSIWLYRPRV